MFRVGIVPSDVPACEYFRARYAAEALAVQGKILLVDVPDPVSRKAIRRHGPNEIVGLKDWPEVDVLVFTRGVLPGRIVDLIPMLQHQGIGVVVDADDAYDRLPSQLATRYKVNPTMSKLYNYDQAKRAMKMADVVTVSTPALTRYRRDAFVVRNQVPKRYLQLVSPQATQQVVGWGGTTAGHPGALGVTHGGVARAISTTGARFLNVGDGDGVQKDLRLEQPPDTTGILDLDEYQQALCQIDVGIAPLDINQYTEAKSWLRPLQLLAAGAQFMASATDEYMELFWELESWCFEHGRTVPAALCHPRGRNWYQETLQALERSRTAGAELSATAKEFVEQRHTVEGHAHEWLEAWNAARRN